MEKYTTSKLSAANPVSEKNKTVISDDAYAICDLINEFINAIRKASRGMIK